MIKPFLSVVIANYNYGRYLSDAIKSITTQCLAPVKIDGRVLLPIDGMDDYGVEIIICDAASTDDSVAVINKNVQYISWWCSEPDGGQSAAFNKGFAHATGEWLTWLNADDLYLKGVFKAFANRVGDDGKAEWVTANKLHFDSNTSKIVSINWGPHVQPPLLRGHRAFSAVFGPSTFWRKSLFDRIGPIDEKLHYAMDSEYWARMTVARVRQTRLNHLCWAFRDHEESKTVGIQTEVVKQKRIAETNYWRTKLGYHFEPTFTNIWYCAWCLWRIVDGSWLKRAIMKHRYEGESFDITLQYE